MKSLQKEMFEMRIQSPFSDQVVRQVHREVRKLVVNELDMWVRLRARVLIDRLKQSI